MSGDSGLRRKDVKISGLELSDPLAAVIDAAGKRGMTRCH